MCVKEPDVAVMVTIEVPVGVGFGFVAPFFVPPQPLTARPTSNKHREPPPMSIVLRGLLLRFRSKGRSERNPKGIKDPAASDSIPRPRCRLDTE